MVRNNYMHPEKVAEYFDQKNIAGASYLDHFDLANIYQITKLPLTFLNDAEKIARMTNLWRWVWKEEFRPGKPVQDDRKGPADKSGKGVIPLAVQNLPTNLSDILSPNAPKIEYAHKPQTRSQVRVNFSDQGILARNAFAQKFGQTGFAQNSLAQEGARQNGFTQNVFGQNDFAHNGSSQQSSPKNVSTQNDVAIDSVSGADQQDKDLQKRERNLVWRESHVGGREEKCRIEEERLIRNSHEKSLALDRREAQIEDREGLQQDNAGLHRQLEALRNEVTYANNKNSELKGEWNKKQLAFVNLAKANHDMRTLLDSINNDLTRERRLKDEINVQLSAANDKINDLTDTNRSEPNRQPKYNQLINDVFTERERKDEAYNQLAAANRTIRELTITLEEAHSNKEELIAKLQEANAGSIKIENAYLDLLSSPASRFLEYIRYIAKNGTKEDQTEFRKATMEAADSIDVQAVCDGLGSVVESVEERKVVNAIEKLNKVKGILETGLPKCVPEECEEEEDEAL